MARIFITFQDVLNEPIAKKVIEFNGAFRKPVLDNFLQSFCLSSQLGMFCLLFFDVWILDLSQCLFFVGKVVFG